MSQLDGGHGIDLVLVSLESELRGLLLDPAMLKHARGVLRARGEKRVRLGEELASVVLGENREQG